MLDVWRRSKRQLQRVVCGMVMCDASAKYLQRARAPLQLLSPTKQAAAFLFAARNTSRLDQTTGNFVGAVCGITVAGSLVFLSLLCFVSVMIVRRSRKYRREPILG